MPHSDLPDAGRIPHSSIDSQLPDRGQKDALEGSLNTPNKSNRYITQDDAPTTPAASRILRLGSDSIANLTNGLKIPVVAHNVSAPPTDAELDSALGEPGTLGSGYLALVIDTDSANGYICLSDGTNWWKIVVSKAV